MDALTVAFSQVWSVATVVAAVITGSLFGWYFVGRFGANLAYVSTRMTAGTVSTLAVAGSLLSGVMFYVGQSIAAYWDNDEGWPRVVSRYGIWVIFALTIGVGSYARIRLHIRRKHREAHQHAVESVEQQEHGRTHDDNL